jgi:NitT/TauT family transport system substrate-binding protein
MAAITATINPKLRLFFATDVSTGGDGIIAKTNLQSIADLKGKKVAVDEGTPSHFLLLYAMNKAGLSQKDIEIISARADETPELLKLGSVDAIVTWEPWLSRAEQYGFHVLFSTKDHNDLIVDVLETLDTTMEKKRGLLEALCRTWEDALSGASTANGITVMAKAYNKDAKVFQSMLAEMRWLNIRENKSWFTDSSPSRAEELLTEAHDCYKSAGKLSGQIPVLEIVDESVVRALKADNRRNE